MDMENQQQELYKPLFLKLIIRFLTTRSDKLGSKKVSKYVTYRKKVQIYLVINVLWGVWRNTFAV